ncbi:MAG: SUMF1/EgtB/PvdO family nonheme iron enzyme, partial [Labilithrix sp.]|nr:SUMF1/EgtB/PvdO family nonheme iron enzyme [Labilithrix sp.]
MSRALTLGAVGMMTASAAVATGCDDDRGARPPRPDEIPVLASIPAGKATIGLELGTQRDERSLEAFHITKFPITVKHYRQCVAAGACDAPALASYECGGAGEFTRLRGPTFNVPGGDELPVTCVTPEQAIGYCRWLGGTLPDPSQWLVAARGTSVRRYAW